MTDPKEQQPDRDELEPETIKDLELSNEDADGVRGGSDHPMCTIPAK